MKDIELIREAADFLQTPLSITPHHCIAQLRALADRMEAQSKLEPVAWFEKTASGEWFLAYSLNPLAETKELFTYPPDAASRISELEAQLHSADILGGKLMKQLAEYKADSERLDFIDTNCEYIETGRVMGSSGSNRFFQVNFKKLYSAERHYTIRAAIDAAITAGRG